MKQPESANSDGNDWTEVASVTELTYTYTEDINTGSTYQFRVKAVNDVGSSDYSSTFDIISATKP